MNNLKHKSILILLIDGTTIRNFLTTNIINHILDNSDFKIVFALSKPEKYSSYFVHERVSYIKLLRKKSWNFSSILNFILRSRFSSINDNFTLKILRKTMPGYKIENLIRYPFPKNKKIFKFLEKFQEFSFRPMSEVKNQFNDINPSLVFTTHLVKRDGLDYLVLAKSKGIPTLGMVKSFDNISSKGYFVFKPQSIIVWNEIMEKEVIDLYEYQKENITISGVPQFDIYKNIPEINKEKFFEKINLDPLKKTILFCTNSPLLGKDDPLHIDFIQSKLEDLNAQLIVRVHFEDKIERYIKKENENVYFQIPGIEEGTESNERVAHINFISDLRDTLFFSDVIVNTGSTIILDAVSASKPVVNIFFDWKETVYINSVKRIYEFVHLKPIADLSQNNMASSKEKLILLIEEFLNGKNPDSKAIKKIEQKMLAGNKKDASLKIALDVINKTY